MWERNLKRTNTRRWIVESNLLTWASVPSCCGVLSRNPRRLGPVETSNLREDRVCPRSDRSHNRGGALENRGGAGAPRAKPTRSQVLKSCSVGDRSSPPGDEATCVTWLAHGTATPPGTTRIQLFGEIHSEQRSGAGLMIPHALDIDEAGPALHLSRDDGAGSDGGANDTGKTDTRGTRVLNCSRYRSD